MKSAEPASTAGIAIGLGLVALAGVIGFDAARMDVPPSYARVGPQIFPFIIAGGLCAVGAYTVWASQAPGGDRPVGIHRDPTDWRALVLISAGLIVHLALLKTMGFVPMAIMLFMTVAWAFGSRRYLRDAIVAVALALIAYFGFTRGLGLQLPAGIWTAMA